MNRTARAKTRAVAVALALAVGSAGLPTEFRLFVRGWNETTKGAFLFDDAAASAVMAANQEHGVDLPIDLEHNMLAEDGAGPDPTARDARGWFQLAVREGELWAVNVRWTSDGAARLADKRQRYVSPAFEIDSDTKRVVHVINAAICALPATHKTPALVAASATAGGCMDPKLVKSALDALESGDSTAALEILKSMIASAAGAPPAPPEGAPPPAPPVENNAAPPAPPAGGEGEDDAKKKTEAASRLMKLTGKSTVAEALAEADVWKQSHVQLEQDRTELAKTAATMESAERRRLCADLVRLGAEYPATIWADATAEKPSTLKTRWLSMPIAELRTHVAEQREARGGTRVTASGGGVTPPPSGAGVGGESKSFNVNGQVVTLDARELAICADAKADPAVFATMKAQRGARARTTTT